MPRKAQPARPQVELGELRVLDGPNRFFSRPAVKLEFHAEEPGAADEVAASAGLAVRRLHVALGMPAPRISARHSVDRRRAMVAFPWRRRTVSQAIGTAAARLARGLTTERRELAGLRAVALGPLPSLPRPTIPIVAITGTNGKSTTTRLIAHIAAESGLRVGMTNSDGIFVQGKLVEAGDWTGFGGAGRILAERGLDLAVLETARGGILLRGIGYTANDVSVVTNISADHLGLQGIDTLDELADVKAAIVRITKRGGWAVLNGGDPRTWAMRRATNANWYPFSLDHLAPAVEEALDAGGRAAVLEREWLVLMGAGRRPVRLARVGDVPVTAAGLARYNIANALAAAAACDALGIPHPQVAAGLRSFALDSEANPGRLNPFERDGIVAIVDFAHNEAGLTGLLEVCRPLAQGGGGKVRLAFGTAGDRTDEILHNLGVLAGRGADDVVICEKQHYLRGRDLDEMNALLRAGAAAGGYAGEVEACPDELSALRTLLARSRRGDVCAVMVHVERKEIVDWLAKEGFARIGHDRLRELVRGPGSGRERPS
jgi:cyanophycin synthetase